MVDTKPDAIGVVVPVHNEEQLLDRCLIGLVQAAAVAPVLVEIVLVLDRCSDASEEIARSFDQVGVIAADRAGVGAARAAGLRDILRRRPVSRLWLATTDADSVVPIEWFSRQVQHAEAGADVVVGTVSVTDWSEHSVEARQRYLARYRPQPGHRHMHGANLSFRAASYLQVGGFTDDESDEDVDLIRRFDAAGCALVWAADLPVLTSARRLGRAPAGFAGHLNRLEQDLSLEEALSE